MVLTNDLIKITKAIIAEDINDYTIQNPSLEEMFINYYK